MVIFPNQTFERWNRADCTVLAVGRVMAGLYILDSSSFTSKVIQAFTSTFDVSLNKAVNCTHLNNVFS
ncbi:hypothetical protein Sjap_017631 [Stephania japonica]|uniref:Uncharacterized protein n=1 Tax=Stephania japonica TaxID=461633 RepID=A0AAP0NM76_9MAGN